jgi:hypothetical protein
LGLGFTALVHVVAQEHLGLLTELFGARIACIITGAEGLLVLALTWRVWRPILREETHP